MRRRALVLAAVVLVGTVAALGVAGSAAGGGRPLAASLSGANEHPSNSSPASGQVAVRLNHGQGTVCFDMTVSNLTSNPSMSHIHKGTADENGPIVIHLFGSGGSGSAPSSTSFTLTNVCHSGISQDLIKDIIQNPDQYYVNVHTSNFPGGEIRGQLSK